MYVIYGTAAEYNGDGPEKLPTRPHTDDKTPLYIYFGADIGIYIYNGTVGGGG